MKKLSSMLVAASLLFVGVASSSCNKDADMSTSGQTSQATDPSKMAEQGAGGVKAKNGGGMMPQPMTAAPGEKTGIPK